MVGTRKLEGLTLLANGQIDINLLLELERQSFVNEPAETREGIEALLAHGTVLALNEDRIKAVAEAISLRKLITIGPAGLTLDSPLRMILENERSHGLLSSLERDYPGRQEYLYAHGIAVSRKGLGYGTAIFAERVRRLVRENDLMFGFVMAEPVNLASMRMYLRQGAVLDKIEGSVYEENKPYFRMVYNAKASFNESIANEGVTLNKDYIGKIKDLLARGYLGTNFERPNLFVFRKRV